MGVENHQVLITPYKGSSSTTRMFSTPRPRTYTRKDKETRVLDPEGLASMYLATQDLVIRLKEALDLSCGLA
jgi:hypothetical protein